MAEGQPKIVEITSDTDDEAQAEEPLEVTDDQKAVAEAAGLGEQVGYPFLYYILFEPLLF